MSFVTVEVVVDPAKILAPVIVWANPEDRTADYHFTRRWLQAAPAATLVEVDSGEEKHCITGDIQTPSTVEQIANKANAIKDQQYALYLQQDNGEFGNAEHRVVAALAFDGWCLQCGGVRRCRSGLESGVRRVRAL